MEKKLLLNQKITSFRLILNKYLDKNKKEVYEKDIIKYLILEILEYIFEIQGKKMEQEDIYFLINKDSCFSRINKTKNPIKIPTF